ncbi:MAG: ParB/RepB/Spo0J family partition protein [Deltaproteobacteria bacterium]|nr:ParB/RepB/Spo0J family partition protein [Deltaproteobacteria bacterium]
MSQKPVLGKGLASLLPGANYQHTPLVEPASGAVSAGPALPVMQEGVSRDRVYGISLLNIDELEANPYQPRREFDEKSLQEMVISIKTNGIIQPLVVRKNAEGKYQLIAGERRLRAAKQAGLKQVPVVIRKSTDRESLELALIENIQRQDLNCIDESLAYLQLIQDFSLTQEEIAERVGKDRTTIANFLRLLRLPELIIEDLKKDILSLGHGKVLLSIEDSNEKIKLRHRIVKEKLSVRALEELIEHTKDNQKTEKHSEEVNTVKNRLKMLALELTKKWGIKIRLKGSDQKGKIVLYYSTRDELDRIINIMQNIG